MGIICGIDISQLCATHGFCYFHWGGARLALRTKQPWSGDGVVVIWNECCDLGGGPSENLVLGNLPNRMFFSSLNLKEAGSFMCMIVMCTALKLFLPLEYLENKKSCLGPTLKSHLD